MRPSNAADVNYSVMEESEMRKESEKEEIKMIESKIKLLQIDEN
jgi:hypothetical protein